jgi:hypothetical protein
MSLINVNAYMVLPPKLSQLKIATLFLLEAQGFLLEGQGFKLEGQGFKRASA